jgi:hypothetical protein
MSRAFPLTFLVRFRLAGSRKRVPAPPSPLRRAGLAREVDKPPSAPLPNEVVSGEALPGSCGHRRRGCFARQHLCSLRSGSARVPRRDLRQRHWVGGGLLHGEECPRLGTWSLGLIRRTFGPQLALRSPSRQEQDEIVPLPPGAAGPALEPDRGTCVEKAEPT